MSQPKAGMQLFQVVALVVLTKDKGRMTKEVIRPSSGVIRRYLNSASTASLISFNDNPANRRIRVVGVCPSKS